MILCLLDDCVYKRDNSEKCYAPNIVIGYEHECRRYCQRSTVNLEELEGSKAAEKILDWLEKENYYGNA